MVTLGRTRSSTAESEQRNAELNADARLLMFLMLAYIIVYIVTFPKMYTSLDESDNFGMAYVLRHGTIYPSAAHCTLSMDVNGPHGTVYRFPIGYPLVLALMSFIGPRALFVVNPAMHLVATVFFTKSLRFLKLPIWLAAVYLFFPDFVLYQRTLFSDGFAASLTTIGFYYILRGRFTPAGIFFGLGLMARSTSEVIALILAAGLLIEGFPAGRRAKSPWASTAAFVLGLLPFVFATGVYNYLTMGSPLKTTYSGPLFAWSSFKAFAPYYAASLALVLPGMIVAPLMYRGPYRRTLIVICTAIFLIAASYHDSTFGENRLESLITVSRQVLPAIPFFLLSYCTWLGGINIVAQRGRLVVPIILVVIAAGISWMHQRALKHLIAIRTEVLATVPAHCVVYSNKDIFKLHQQVWDTQTYRIVGSTAPAQIESDLKTQPVYVVVYFRNRGVANEDHVNDMTRNDLKRHWVLARIPSPRGSDVLYYRAEGYHP